MNRENNENYYDFNEGDISNRFKEKDRQIHALSEELQKANLTIRDFKQCLKEIMMDKTLNVATGGYKKIDANKIKNKEIQTDNECFVKGENRGFDLMEHYKYKCERFQKELEKKDLELIVANELIESLSNQISKIYDQCYGDSKSNFIQFT